MSKFANADKIRRSFLVSNPLSGERPQCVTTEGRPAQHVKSKPRRGECPLRGIAKSVPAQHIKKSLLSIYMMVMIEVFSHSSWNGW
jgi:hypothetical protein